MSKGNQSVSMTFSDVLIPPVLTLISLSFFWVPSESSSIPRFGRNDAGFCDFCWSFFFLVDSQRSQLNPACCLLLFFFSELVVAIRSTVKCGHPSGNVTPMPHPWLTNIRFDYGRRTRIITTDEHCRILDIFWFWSADRYQPGASSPSPPVFFPIAADTRRSSPGEIVQSVAAILALHFERTDSRRSFLREDHAGLSVSQNGECCSFWW